MFLSYALSRWRFTRGFEPDGDDFVYRPRPTAPAIRVSRTEREELLRTFRRKFWLYRLGTFAVMFALVFLLAGVGLLIPTKATETLLMVGSLLISVPLMVAILILDRRLLELPSKRFADRAWVAPGRSWREAYDQRAQRRSWLSYAVWGLTIVAFAWLLFPGPRAVWWALPAWLAYFGLCHVIWSYNVWQKCKIGRHSRG